VIGLLAAWLIVRWRRRRRALALAHTAPRDSIVSTYRTFTKRAGAAGTARLPGETPEDYRARLAVLLADPEPLDRLTDLTVQAAYAPDEPSTDEALDALADADGALRELKRVRRRGKRTATDAGR
jgi:hypothetical protein